jgi:hypothetical protein
MRLLVMFVLVSLPSGAWAQAQPLRKGIRVEAGFSDNHRGHDRSAGLAIRGFGVLGERGLVSAEGGALIGSPYLVGDGGVDVRVPVLPRLSLLARGGVGLTFEEDFIGPFWRYGGGIEVLLSARHRLSFTYQRGGHATTDNRKSFLFGVSATDACGVRSAPRTMVVRMPATSALNHSVESAATPPFDLGLSSTIPQAARPGISA